MGQYAVNYALLILVVGNSGSSIRAGLFILAFTIPSATLGPISGVIVDRLSRGFVLSATNVARALLCVAVAALDEGRWDAVPVRAGVLRAVAVQHSGYSAAALPHVVRQEELTTANSLINLGGLFAEAVGIVVLAALMLKTVGADPCSSSSACLFARCGVSRGDDYRPDGARHGEAVAAGRAGGRATCSSRGRGRRCDATRSSYLALIISVVGIAALLVGVTVLPRYAKDELGVSAENIVFVFAPGAIGIFLACAR